MGKTILVTGGARSGKSCFAEQMLTGTDNVLYIATAINKDLEMNDRITRHQAQRNSKWGLLEAYKDFNKYKIFIKEHDFIYILVDCVTNMVSNLMLETEHDWEKINVKKLEGIEKKIAAEFDKLLDLNKSFSGELILVTNELGMGLVPIYPLGRYFRDIAGRINQKLAACADEVYFLVSGIPWKIKGNL